MRFRIYVYYVSLYKQVFRRFGWFVPSLNGTALPRFGKVATSNQARPCKTFYVFYVFETVLELFHKNMLKIIVVNIMILNNCYSVIHFTIVQ